MKKLTILIAALLFTMAANAQVTQLTVVNKTSCDIYYNIGGDFSGQPCPGTYFSFTYTANAGSAVTYTDPSTVSWINTPPLGPGDEIHYVQFYNTDDPACITAYQVGPCSPMSTLVGPITIYDLANCTIICNPMVTATWTSGPGPNAATVTFK